VNAGEAPPPPAEDAAARLRDAYRRRGPVEANLAGNRGQAAIVRERDSVVVELLGSSDPPVRALLDLGCGDGAVLGMLADALHLDRAVGVDLLPERVERARAARPHLDIRVADGTALPFPDGSFDAVLAMTVFSSVPASMREALAREIARVVRPGGCFAWYDMRRRNPANPDVSPFRAADVARLLPGWPIRRRSLTLAPPIARRLGRLSPIAYPLLSAVPVLRTHEAGTARRPESVAARA
jgi:SAM-dependent methyltransferase